MLFRQTRNTHSLQSKISQNKSSNFKEMEKLATFLTLDQIPVKLTNQGPKGRIRTPRDRVWPRGTEQGPAGQTPRNAFECLPIVVNRTPPDAYVIFPTNQRRGFCRAGLKAAFHWVRVNALSAESSPKLTWDAMGLRADSARWLSERAEPLTR